MTAIYPKFRQQLLSWALAANAPAGLTFHVVGVDAGYTYNAAHTSLADIPAGATVSPETQLTSVTVVDGVVDAADVEWDAVLTAGETITGLVVYLKSGAGATYLAAFFDTSTDASLPQLIESTTGFVRWNAAGIFKI